MAGGPDEVAFYGLEGVLVCETPVHAGFGARMGFIRLSRPYLPGSFLRGLVGLALARLVCVREELPADHTACEHRHECPYALLFGEHEAGKEPDVLFRFAYPIHEGCGGVFLPAPLSLLYCEDCGFTTGYDAGRRLHDLAAEPFCPRCDKGLRPFAGFVCDRCGRVVRRPLRLDRVVRTAVSRELSSAFWKPYLPGGVSEDEEGEVSEGRRVGSLHALDAIPAGTRLRLSVLLDARRADLLDLLREALARGLPDEGIGGSSSRGLGKLSVRGLRVVEVSPDLVAARVDEIGPDGPFCLRL